jgi:hypothetical protein
VLLPFGVNEEKTVPSHSNLHKEITSAGHPSLIMILGVYETLAVVRIVLLSCIKITSCVAFIYESELYCIETLFLHSFERHNFVYAAVKLF